MPGRKKHGQPANTRNRVEEPTTAGPTKPLGPVLEKLLFVAPEFSFEFLLEIVGLVRQTCAPTKAAVFRLGAIPSNKLKPTFMIVAVVAIPMLVVPLRGRRAGYFVRFPVRGLAFSSCWGINWQARGR